jgi:hypothetical protein
MKSVIGPIALTGAWLVVAIPGCIESSCEEKRTCGGYPAPTESDAGSGGDLTSLPRATGGRAGGTGFGLGGGSPAAGGTSPQGGSAGTEAEPGANGGETAAGGAPAANGGETAAGGEPSVSDAGAGGTGATPCQPDPSAQGTCSQGESGSGGQAGTDAVDGGAAGRTDPGEAGNAGAPTTEGCDPESRVRKELLVDGRFEPASSGWRLVDALLRTGGDAQSAPNFIELGGSNMLYTSAIQTVEFPPEAADITLSFYVRIESTNTMGDDFMYYGFSLNETQLEAYPLEQESISEWSYVETDFPATYAGQVKDLIFAGQTDSEPGFKTFFIDTVSLTALVCP